jgi:hypothetical protein
VSVILITLGPIRLIESVSSEVFWFTFGPNQAGVSAKSWRSAWASLYLDARAWGGYSIRALTFVLLVVLTARSLFSQWRNWLWTEWTTLGCGAIIAGCWVYDEFVARPALDRTVRVTLLGTSLLVIAFIAGVLIWGWSALRLRYWCTGGIGDRN